jgi:hypothetical protein
VTEDIQPSTGQSTAEDSPGPAGGPSAQTSTSAGGVSVQERAAALANERPEAAVGAAFAGGLLLAMILKRFAR